MRRFTLPDALRDAEVLETPAGGATGAASADAPEFARTDDEAPPAAKPSEQPKPDPKLEQLEAQLTELKKSHQRELDQLAEARREAERNAQFWHQQAQGGGKPEPSRPSEDADDGEEIDPVEAFSSNDTKAIRKYLKRMGFVPREDLEAHDRQFTERLEKRIRSEREAITEESDVVKMFPDLKDQTSDLFKRTQKKFLENAETELGKSSKALRIAALEAAAELGVPPGGSKPDPVESEEERRKRVARQAGPTGSHPSEVNDDDDELTPQQKRFAKVMGVSEEAYRKRAREGVRTSLGTREGFARRGAA